MVHKCIICKKKEWQLILKLHAIEAEKLCIVMNQQLSICYDCLSVFIASLIKQIDSHKSKKEIAIPSIPWARRVRMGKISKEEMINILKKISSIKNIKDFRRIDENEKET